MNISHRQLRMFMVLAKHLNFTHAAKELYVTQPAISMQIKQLEAEIGLPLFEHIGKKIHLTPAGEETLKYAKSISQELTELDHVIADLKGIHRGHLKLAVANSLSHLAAKIMGKFLQVYPDINITLDVGNRQWQIEQLHDNQVDLAIMGKPPKELPVISQLILESPIMVVAAPNHPLAQEKNISMETISQEKFIYGEAGSGTRVAMDHSFSELRCDKSHIEVSNNEMVKHCIQEGIGVGLLPSVAVESELAHGLLVNLDVEGFPQAYEVNVIYLKEKRLSLVAKAFRDFAAQFSK